MKEKINQRIINSDGLVIHDETSLVETLFIDPKYIERSTAKFSADIEKYNHWAKIYDLPAIKEEITQIDHNSNQKNWKLPQKYKNLNIEEYLIEKCTTLEEQERVISELAEFSKRNLYDLLKYLVYLVEVMRENNIIYGIGRGSSVSSYCLYLIGVHRVNSLRYNLDIKEFLK